ncbi:hypothetical protein ACT80S_06690 [Ramlibacter sp. MAHUQ-53]|uniref:hypothetical protein n=1 Tax=unclassified Ramlibacter TaxID=2617605 RepID=UPI00362780AC
MRWLKPNLRSSLYALLGHGSEPSADHVHLALDRIRDAMLELLGEDGQAAYPAFVRRVRFAADPQALWFARSDLMGALAALHGEARARQQLESVTAMFTGLLPASLEPRPSRHPR